MIDGSPISDWSPSRALRGRTLMMGRRRPGNRTGQEFAHFHFDQLQQFGVVNHVALVQNTMMYGPT